MAAGARPPGAGADRGRGAAQHPQPRRAGQPPRRRRHAAATPEPGVRRWPPSACSLVVADISEAMADASALVATGPRSHIVVRGDSPWSTARRYGVRLDELLERNGLDARAVLRPGMVLAIDAGGPGAGTAT